MIDEQGSVVLPVEYKAVWKFYGKPNYSNIIVTNEDGKNIVLKDFLLTKGKTEENNENNRRSQCDDDAYGHGDDYRCEHYEEFAGTYAQEVAGYSDEDIYDAFDGDPDAYWNID